MTPERIAELRKLCERPVPWRRAGPHSDGSDTVCDADGRVVLALMPHEAKIAPAIVAIPELLAALSKPGEAAEQIALAIARTWHGTIKPVLDEFHIDELAASIAQALTRHAASAEARARELEAELKRQKEAYDDLWREWNDTSC